MQFQRGQAMVEYAILFIVLSILFIGGAELGMAALASYKNTDAAKTGVSEYAEVNQRRLNILNAEKQYLISLAGLGCSNIALINSGVDYDTLDCSNSSSTDPITADNFIKLLDRIHKTDDTLSDDGYDSISDFAVSNELKIITSTSGSPGLRINLNSDSEINCDAIATCEDSDLNDSPLDTENLEAIIAKEESVALQYESPKKYIKLIILQHLKLALMPLYIPVDEDENDMISLSEAKINLGNHSSNMAQPNCTGGIYDDGLPSDRYIYREYYDNTGNRHIFQTGSVVYLFNPLPINTSSCQTIPGGLSVLIAGYIPPQSSINSVEDFENNFFTGLPKLNQAMYGMYKNDLGGNLIPPGKMCYLDDDGNDSCPSLPSKDLYVDNIGPTGYYRWNKGSDGSGTEDIFKYTINDVDDDLLNGFRPAMQIECNVSLAAGIESQAVDDDSCAGPHSKLRIHTRYRKIFEGFLTFGLQELNVADGDLENALKLFYNPNDVGVAGSNQINGTIDSEIGSLGANGIPTVKRHKDFRGCYEVDVETNQISACN